jgi:hypothetical protein
MDNERSSTDHLQHAVPRRRWRWRWFALGFGAVFAGMLFFYPVYPMHPSGEYIVRQPLWAFYADAFPRMFGPRALGPADSNLSALGGVAVEHLVLSALGGCIVAVIGWWLRR